MRACFPFDGASGGLVDRRRLDVARSVCLEDIIGCLEELLLLLLLFFFAEFRYRLSHPTNSFFKLLQMLHYRDSIRVSKDILVLLLLFLLLCPLPIFLLLWIFILFACYLLTSPSFSVIFCFVSVSDSAVALLLLLKLLKVRVFSVFFFFFGLSVQGCSLGICHTSES